jgi:CRP-like cAMP-binding protein
MGVSPGRSGRCPLRREDRALFIVVAGELEVVRGGQRRAVLRPGDLVGEIAFIDGRPRSAAVCALGAAEVQRIRPADVEALAGRDPTIALRFVWEVARIPAARLRGCGADGRPSGCSRAAGVRVGLHE